MFADLAGWTMKEGEGKALEVGGRRGPGGRRAETRGRDAAGARGAALLRSSEGGD